MVLQDVAKVYRYGSAHNTSHSSIHALSDEFNYVEKLDRFRILRKVSVATWNTFPHSCQLLDRSHSTVFAKASDHGHMLPFKVFNQLYFSIRRDGKGF